MAAFGFRPKAVVKKPAPLDPPVGGPGVIDPPADDSSPIIPITPTDPNPPPVDTDPGYDQPPLTEVPIQQPKPPEYRPPPVTTPPVTTPPVAKPPSYDDPTQPIFPDDPVDPPGISLPTPVPPPLDFVPLPRPEPSPTPPVLGAGKGGKYGYGGYYAPVEVDGEYAGHNQYVDYHSSAIVPGVNGSFTDSGWEFYNRDRSPRKR